MPNNAVWLPVVGASLVATLIYSYVVFITLRIDGDLLAKQSKYGTESK